MYCVFHYIYGQFQGILSFGQFWKKVGIRSDPPPPLLPRGFQHLFHFQLQQLVVWWMQFMFCADVPKEWVAGPNVPKMLALPELIVWGILGILLWGKLSILGDVWSPLRTLSACEQVLQNNPGRGQTPPTVGQEAVELICQNARKMRQNEAMSLWPLLTTKMKLIWM